MSNPFPSFNQLTEAQLTKIEEAIDIGIAAVEVVSEFTAKDGRPCLNVKIEGIQVSLWWVTLEKAGAFFYPDSLKARKVIIEQLKDQLAQI